MPFFEFVRHEQGRVHLYIAAILAAGLVLLVARRPAPWLLLLVAVLPFDTYLLALIYRLGVPAAVVKPLRLWQYGIAAGLAIAAVRKRRENPRHIDALDKVTIGFLVLGTAYLLLPGLFVGGGLGSHLSFYARELGWRSDVLYVALFLIVRWLQLGREDAERIITALLLSGTAVAAIALFEFVDKNSWNHFAVKVIRVTRYEQHVLGYQPSTNFDPTSVLTFGTFGGHRFVRVGGTLDYQALGFYMAVCLGLLSELVVRARTRGWMLVSLPLMSLALLLTQTRSALIAGAVAVLIGARSQIGRSVKHRIRLYMALSLLVVAALPFVLFGGVGHRYLGDSDNKQHRGAFSNGESAMLHHPLGRGLATSAGAGQQVVNNGSSSVVSATGANSLLVTESQWLQVGTQLGFVGLILWSSMAGLMIVRLRPEIPDRRNDPRAFVGAGARNSLIGLLVGGTFLQPFINLPVSFTTFIIIGLGTSLVDQVRLDPIGPPGAAVTSGSYNDLATIGGRLPMDSSTEPHNRMGPLWN